MSAVDYGDRYWCVKTPLSDDGEVYLHSDRAVVTDCGALLFQHVTAACEVETTMAFASGEWRAYYAASCIDGAPVAVEHWLGEVRQ